MAYENPGGGGESFYDDAPPSKEKEASGSEEGEKTYVLPKAILAGKDFEPGDELVVRIVSMQDDQIEVTYAPPKEQEKRESEGPGEMAPAPAGGGEGGGGSEFASMME